MLKIQEEEEKERRIISVMLGKLHRMREREREKEKPRRMLPKRERKHVAKVE